MTPSINPDSGSVERSQTRVSQKPNQSPASAAIEQTHPAEPPIDASFHARRRRMRLLNFDMLACINPDIDMAVKQHLWLQIDAGRVVRIRE